MGIAADISRIFFATGNGQGHANGQTPASGRTPLTTLDEVVANFAVSFTGKFTLTDYFEPYEYTTLDAWDRDLGSGGVALLDPTVFKGTGVSRIAVTVGKNGKAYIMNANNLGGFKQGLGGVDNVLQTIVADGAVFGGPGSYPLEGGYIYFTAVGFPTSAYKLGLDSFGKPQFTKVGATARNSAGRVGVGIPTITTYQGQPGTGIVWITDPDAGLTAYFAVPDANGILQPVATFATGGLNKFQRPAFGNGRLYVSDVNGNVMCLGSPVSLPLQCSQPVDFGSVAIGSTATQIVNCTALIPVTKINGCVTADIAFQCINSTLPQGPLAPGSTFSFPVTWDLTHSSINDAQNASFGKVTPGVKSTSLTLFTTNGVTQYSSQLPVSLQGNTISKTAFLSITPFELDFKGLVVGLGGKAPTSTLYVIISNIGALPLTFTGIAWSSTVDEDDTTTYNNITVNPDGSKVVGEAFTSTVLPSVGDIMAPGNSIAVDVAFTTNTVGNFQGALAFWSTGGSGYVVLGGSGSTEPIANISVSTVEGGFDYSEPLVMDFGSVAAGTSRAMTLRLCNSGGSALEITKSKPPIQPELTAANPLTDLHEGQFIDVDTCAEAEIDIIAAPLGVNYPDHVVSDVWILNTDEPNFGVHDVAITASIVTRQIGPLMPDGTARYLYLGCYLDGTGRQLSKQYNNNTGNDNAWCQTQCLANGYIFAGTEYHTECWCGNVEPSVAKYTAESAKKCTFTCVADPTQACGGTGTYISIYYDRTRYKPDAGAIPLSTSMGVVSASSGTSTSSGGSGSSGSSTGTGVSTTISTRTPTVTPIPTPTGKPVIVQSVGAYSYIGCYTEGTNIRALTEKAYANDSLTIEICAAVCVGYTWFGAEYQRECYCGNTVQTGSVPGSTACVMTCKGNPLEYCGGSRALQMYNNIVSPSSTSPMSSTILSSSSSSSSSTVTSSSSSSARSSSFYTGASTSSSTSSLPSSSSSPFSSSATSTSTPSTMISVFPGTASPSSVDLFIPTTSFSSSSTSFSPNTNSSSSSSTSQSSASAQTSTISTSTLKTSSTVTPTQTGPTTVPSVGAFKFVGCYTEATVGRALNRKLFGNKLMTVEMCADLCAGFTWFGVEYSRECFCGYALAAGSVLTTSGCTMVCGGNPLEYCGGSNRLNMYNTLGDTTSTTPSSTGASPVGSSSSLSTTSFASSLPAVTSPTTIATTLSTYRGGSDTSLSSVAPSTTGYLGFYPQGCFWDPPGGPFTSHNMPLLYSNDGMTVERCIEAAKARLTAVPATTYRYVGLEYGRECFAHTAAPTPEPTQLVGSKACTIPCKGNTNEMCGGSNMYNLYASGTAISGPATGTAIWSSAPAVSTKA